MQVDSGSHVFLVWSKLVPQPSDDAPKHTIVGIMGHLMSLPVVPLQVSLFGKTIEVDALVYDNCPVDLLLRRNCDKFSDILMTAEDPTQSFQVTTRHLQAESRQEDDTLTKQLEKAIKPNPLTDMLGENFDFPQTNLSVQDTDQIHEEADDFDRQFLAKDQKTDPSLAELWQMAVYSSIGLSSQENNRPKWTSLLTDSTLSRRQSRNHQDRTLYSDGWTLYNY